MLTILSSVLGGLGLFLLGMALMTDGLASLAGGSLRKHLADSTRTRRRAVFSGAWITATVQSSSATTLATIGFVSAGLLSFESAIGVVIGANIGTTSTGWLVSLFGLKFSIAKLALPMIGVGALMRLLAKGRKVHLGTVIAGFGLIFVGIDFLQAGMEGLAEHLNPAEYALPGLWGRLVLVLIGLLMTVVMQSSSAAVATTLAALAGGTLTVDQAAALVVGQNVGTTVTAVIGAVGASVPARRTAVVHVIFNLTTGLIAFLMLPAFTHLVTQTMEQWAPHDHALTIAAFHTAFNVLGALIFYPLTPYVARFVEAVVREEEGDLLRYLHPGLHQLPDVAVAAVRQSLVASTLLLLKSAGARLLGAGQERKATYQEIRNALERMTAFLGDTSIAVQNESIMRRRIAVLHTLDNLAVVIEELEDPIDLVRAVHSPRVGVEMKRVSADLERMRLDLEEDERLDPIVAEELLAEYSELSKSTRPVILNDMATGNVKTSEALLDLAVQRWIERLLRHLWRAMIHLEEAADSPPGD